ncbi:hypothetical protein ACIGKM_15145 [Ectopseudomonas toyotomiensis]|uniref:hypothetical protein n=1 Tax=Ectopseudomonas toyotomiensis TaxID=554344 RepID=UPI0037CB96CB
MTNTVQTKISFPLYLLQIATSSLILFIFSLYVWLLQINYDKSIAGYKKALFFSLIIFGAGFSYDYAKKILFLKQETFRKFGKNLFESAIQIIAICLLAAASITFTSMSFVILGQVFYVATLGWTLLVVNSLIRVIETASNG